MLPCICYGVPKGLLSSLSISVEIGRRHSEIGSLHLFPRRESDIDEFTSSAAWVLLSSEQRVVSWVRKENPSVAFLKHVQRLAHLTSEGGSLDWIGIVWFDHGEVREIGIGVVPFCVPIPRQNFHSAVSSWLNLVSKTYSY